MALFSAVISEYPQKIFGLFLMVSQSMYGNNWFLLNPPIAVKTALIWGSLKAQWRSSNLLFMLEELKSSILVMFFPKTTSNPIWANRWRAVSIVSGDKIEEESDGAMTATQSPDFNREGYICFIGQHFTFNTEQVPMYCLYYATLLRTKNKWVRWVNMFQTNGF